MSMIKHGLRRRSFLLLPFALLLAGIAFAAVLQAAVGDDESDAEDGIDIMAFDLP